MKYFDWDSFTLVLLVVIPFALFGGLIATGYWSNQQTRVMYQTIYQKNIECRISYKDRDLRYIDNVCGKLPVFEDYQQ